ncbi:MAG: AAA family ATPase, partial [Bacillota bacterium]|nr:AAA family ATPase [Bacillota bacterium]
MLVEFRAKNFKSFKDEIAFSMVPAPKQKGLDYSILKNKIGSKEYKGLSSAVIYGPNAAGKTNIIGAMEVFKTIVLRGNIRNSERSTNVPNTAVNMLELIPNNSVKEKIPVEFSIKFIDNNLLIDYQLSLDIGGFLEDEYNRRVLSEILYVNENLVFSRKDTLQFDDLKVIKEYLVNDFEDYELGVTTLAKSNLISEELFLMNGFKAMFSSKLVSIISNWFETKFMVIYRADSLYLSKKFLDSKKHIVFVEKTVNDAAEMFGINSNALAYVSPDEDSESKLCSVFKGDANNGAFITAEQFESYGTIRFINMFPLVLNV